MDLRPLLQHPKFVKIRTAIYFAAFGSVSLALGLGLIWKVLKTDNTAFLQQSIGDTSSLLALQAQLELERLAREVGDITREKVKSQINRIKQEDSQVRITSKNAMFGPALQAAASEIAAANSMGLIEVAPDISEISVWTMEGGAPSRIFLAVNSGFGETMPQRIPKLKELEEANRSKVQRAFHGHRIFASDALPGVNKAIALIAVPMGHGEVTEIAAAHVSLEKIQKLFAMDGLVESELVDVDGVVLAHRNAQEIGQKDSDSRGVLAPLFEKVKDPKGVPSGVLAMKDSHGKPFYGGFRRLGSLGVSVISVVSAEQGESSLDGARRQVIVYVVLMFVLLLAGGMWHLNHVWPHESHGQVLVPPPLNSSPASGSGDTPEPTLVTMLTEAENRRKGASLQAALAQGPRKIAVIAMHGSLRGFNQLLEGAGPEDTTDALNDYFLSMATLVRASGGKFEYFTGASFGAIWEIREGEGHLAVSKAVSCALALRKEMVRLNESRKLDGKKPLRHALGVHAGQVLIARLGAVPELREAITGEALACARALDRLAALDDKDFVASQDVLESAHGVFKGNCVGESKLTLDTGLTAYYAIQTYRDDASIEIGRLEPSTESEDATGSGRLKQLSRWLVNNGSQIVGPFTIPELSKMLYMQELDFDCECWHEETGRFSRLEIAGIFNGSQEPNAHFWVYDGEQVVGPITEGFVITAAQRNAFGPEATVCEKSTIMGWKKLSEFVTGRKAGTDSGGEAA